MRSPAIISLYFLDQLVNIEGEQNDGLHSFTMVKLDYPGLHMDVETLFSRLLFW